MTVRWFAVFFMITCMSPRWRLYSSLVRRNASNLSSWDSRRRACGILVAFLWPLSGRFVFLEIWAQHLVSIRAQYFAEDFHCHSWSNLRMTQIKELAFLTILVIFSSHFKLYAMLTPRHLWMLIEDSFHTSCMWPWGLCCDKIKIKIISFR